MVGGGRGVLRRVYRALNQGPSNSNKGVNREHCVASVSSGSRVSVAVNKSEFQIVVPHLRDFRLHVGTVLS